MNLEDHYDTLWEQSLEKFNRGEFQLDSMIDDANDTRYGMTLLARPSTEIKEKIVSTLDEIRSVAPHQYYYPKSDIHLTVLSIISCQPNFSLSDINTAEYSNLINSVLKSTSPIEITFKGLTASPSCIMIRGFPENNQLHHLRNNLREEFKQAALPHTIDKRYHRQTAHVTVIRFKDTLSDAKSFVKKISDLKDRNFGSCTIDDLELVANDWYQRKENVELIKKFMLS